MLNASKDVIPLTLILKQNFYHQGSSFTFTYWVLMMFQIQCQVF
jgi:hypothetical protein